MDERNIDGEHEVEDLGFDSIVSRLHVLLIVFTIYQSYLKLVKYNEVKVQFIDKW